MKRPLLAGAVVLGLVVAVLWAASRPVGQGPLAPLTPTFVVGSETSWRLSLSGHSELPPLQPAQPPMPSDLLTTGQVRLRHYGLTGGMQKLGLSLARLDEATLTLFGAPAMQDRAALEAALTSGEAVLTMRPEGDLAGFDFTPGAHNVFKSFAQTVAGELALPVREGPRWTVLDTTLRGRAEATYTRTAEGFSRVRTRYLKLNAFGAGLRDVTVAARTDFTLTGGELTRVRSSESLEGFTADGTRVVSTLELELVRETSAPLLASLPTALEPSKPGQLVVPADAKQQMLAQRIDGLTPQGLMDGVATYVGASPQAMVRFLPKASGLLVAQPELCADVAARAKADGTPTKERVFALEVLAAAGTPEAQAAMRDVLDSPALRSDPDRVERYQRLSLLRAPTRETVEFVGAAWRAGTREEKQTLALVLGATAGQFSRGGGDATAWVQALDQALRSSSDPQVRGSLVGALGNAGLASNVGEVLAVLRDPQEQVRADAVMALRKTPVPEARAAVVRALEDPSVAVRANAVELLRRWKPDATERTALTQGLRTGRLSLLLGHDVLNALEPFTADAEVREVLAWVTTQRAADPSLQRRARAMLGGAP